VLRRCPAVQKGLVEVSKPQKTIWQRVFAWKAEASCAAFLAAAFAFVCRRRRLTTLRLAPEQALSHCIAALPCSAEGPTELKNA